MRRQPGTLGSGAAQGGNFAGKDLIHQIDKAGRPHLQRETVGFHRLAAFFTKTTPQLCMGD